MNLKKAAIFGAVISSALILVGCNLYKTSGGETGSTGTATEQMENVPVSGNLITYTDSGFSPAQVSVKVGDTVTFKNDSKANIQVNSAPHPAHTQFPELNIGSIATGESKTVTFTTAGTKKYHNHLNPSQTGTIVVE
ncbi:hypothetical protein A3D07_01590 [Candidatus Curtissbacteria bacterium RIFCSPHIGHO2_02_FULL_42_15]|uniref:EfeO-type cupredoxin-like domain-containing protein n=1 Tax=Candidatus Curtissbacteria bacterium RIFCSPHIGHO2_02_FULL_42_15 TaxID=1797716 RepID=A0A1F5GFP3_9BACT|nr:MAG: hypothetical protein A3D07_01590 [Candidatus Curtissbacteria bacterium RIFCSPHIGHO2_02_FULL_42_15]